MTGKLILPWFGGAAAVWATCLVFYQAALLAGYSYAALLTRGVPQRWRRALHSAMLLISLTLLPIGPGVQWAMSALEHPVLRILSMLTISLALPFVTLSATSPLLQQWLAQPDRRLPYWLFAVSNAASLIALFAYPALIEPTLTMNQQRLIWSVAYVLFVALSALSVWAAQRQPAPPHHRAEALQPLTLLTWFALSAAGSMLLLSVTNHLTQNVAAVPLLWVLPLGVYLLTFIIAFTEGVSRMRTVWSRLLLFGLAVLAYAIYDINVVEPVQIAIPVLLFGLFSGCLFCHGELYARRPGPVHLTAFYFAISLGGAAGGVFVGLIAPVIFTGIYELPVSMLLIAGLALVLSWNTGWGNRAIWAAVSAAMAVVLAFNVRSFDQSSLSQRRSFYGALRVVQSGLGEHQVRTLFHGTIEHGAQFLLPPGRWRPTTYYGPDSGIGIVLRECFPGAKRVGVIGLGVGTLAAYGQSGDTFRFFEINRQVVDLAQSLFFYLRESKARIEMVVGDGRLSLQRERGAAYDVLAVDAFSGDAIPVHLLTREAFALYWQHLRPDGVLALHVSNDYLELASVAGALAVERGYQPLMVRNHEDQDDLVLSSDWVLVTRNMSVLDNPGIKLHSIRFTMRPHVWTDDYNNLLQVLKLPSLK